MDLSIIINNYETRGLLKQCLKGIQFADLPFTYEVIVIDNGSKERIDKMMMTNFKEFIYIRNEINKGMGGGHNTGILNSTGRNIFIVNPDITIIDNSVITLMNFLDQNEKVGIAAPKILNPDGGRQVSCLRFPKLMMPVYRRTFFGKTFQGRKYLQKFEMCDPQSDLTHTQQVDWVIGSCFMIKRNILDEVGLFDERFFLFMEDTDLCRRVKQAGWQVWYNPQARVINYPSQLSRKEWKGFKSWFSKYTFIHLISWLKYLQKWGPKQP